MILLEDKMEEMRLSVAAGFLQQTPAHTCSYINNTFITRGAIVLLVSEISA